MNGKLAYNWIKWILSIESESLVKIANFVNNPDLNVSM